MAETEFMGRLWSVYHAGVAQHTYGVLSFEAMLLFMLFEGRQGDACVCQAESAGDSPDGHTCTVIRRRQLARLQSQEHACCKS